MERAAIKPLIWVGGCKKDLLTMPDEVQDLFGFALHEAQSGKKHDSAKPLKGFGSAGILEIVENWGGNAYRAVYTVKFASNVYVLHCFQKKSTRGISTQKHDLETIEARLRTAEAHAKRVRT